MNKKRTKGHRYYQGKFEPQNPEKYRGDPRNIVFRSSWEKMVMAYLDTNPAIIEWASEELVIPYICATDGRKHRYFVDFWAKVRKKDGKIRQIAIEVKPESQTKPPRKGKNEKAYMNRVAAYMKNKSKWAAAQEFCEKYDMDFHIITEKTLNL